MENRTIHLLENNQENKVYTVSVYGCKNVTPKKMFVDNKVSKIKILVTKVFKYNFLPVLVSLLTLTTVVKIKEVNACA